jgi:4,5-DOPA dioxygenase extradiol
MLNNKMPVLFIGHGSPMNAIEDNRFARGWNEVAQMIPKPEAILCISAHWETWGTLATASDQPRTIHDFGGFPQALYDMTYPAPGSPALADRVQALVRSAQVGLDLDWGFDHGSWSVLWRMYPEADIPVIQLSLDYTQPPDFHYSLAKELAPLREEGVLILGSGNIVHNLRRMALKNNDYSTFNEPYALDWAAEADQILKRLIRERKHADLVNYRELGSAVQLAVPTPEHYLPLLYALALQEDIEEVTLFNDEPLAGSITMTSLIIG